MQPGMAPTHQQSEAEPEELVMESDPLVGFDDSAMDGIMASLAAFQNNM